MLSILLAACQAGGPGKESKEDEEEALPTPVEVALVERGTVVAQYTGTATLEADGEATAYARVGGEVMELLVEEGDTVTDGQPVARIDDRRLRLEVQRSKAALEKARQEYQRNVELHQRGLLPAGTFEGLKFDLDGLAAAYELARLELSHATVRAPIAGVVSERLIKAGNTIVPNSGIFRITDMDPLLAYLYVPEQDYRKLRVDQQAALRVDALPGETFVGRIARISPVIDPATGTFKVTVEVSDSEQLLKPGMFGRVAVIYDTREDVVLVQRAALLDSNLQSSVFVIDGDQAVRREITLGYSSGSSVEVVSGLNAGDEVVMVGQGGLKDQAKVNVIRDGEALAKIKPEGDGSAPSDASGN
ncbi:MAG: efflux RND transporter periplasmic adaptor subunit [Xanthomonadales bacterium]|nr:efflux RND transporter periplasmic adaptor subunit [Xanthomonadales bacterium]